MARVEKVHPGKDGLVRTATVKAQKGVFNRPVQRLHRLEIDAAAPQVPVKLMFLLMVGRSRERTLLMLKVYLFVSLKRELSSPKEDKVGRMLRPIVVLVLGSLEAP